MTAMKRWTLTEDDDGDLTTIVDRLEAWAEHSERIARTEADSPRTEQHKNIAANYRELIRIARESMPA